jgi:hypothetical protein
MLVILPIPHLEALARPSNPKVLQAKERASIPYSFVVFTLDPHLSLLKEVGSVSLDIHAQDVRGGHGVWKDGIPSLSQP